MARIERSDIYDVIDGERNYQDSKWGLKDHPLPQFVCDIDEHLRRLKNHCYNLDNLEMLEEIRKIGALTVKCMEVHGFIERQCLLNNNKQKETRHENSNHRSSRLGEDDTGAETRRRDTSCPS